MYPDPKDDPEKLVRVCGEVKLDIQFHAVCRKCSIVGNAEVCCWYQDCF